MGFDSNDTDAEDLGKDLDVFLDKSPHPKLKRYCYAPLRLALAFGEFHDEFKMLQGRFSKPGSMAGQKTMYGDPSAVRTLCEELAEMEGKYPALNYVWGIIRRKGYVPPWEDLARGTIISSKDLRKKKGQDGWDVTDQLSMLCSSAALVVPIYPDTKRNDLMRLWPSIERTKNATYKGQKKTRQRDDLDKYIRVVGACEKSPTFLAAVSELKISQAEVKRIYYGAKQLAFGRFTTRREEARIGAEHRRRLFKRKPRLAAYTTAELNPEHPEHENYKAHEKAVRNLLVSTRSSQRKS